MMLPEHGKIECRVCYQGIKEKVFEPALHWRMVNNLVLGVHLTRNILFWAFLKDLRKQTYLNRSGSRMLLLRK